MNKILKVRNVGDYSRWVGHTDRHLLVSVIDYAEVSPVRHSLNNSASMAYSFMTKRK